MERMTSPASSDEEEGKGDKSHDLREFLWESSIKSSFHFTPHRFIPEGVVDRLVTKEVIRASLFSSPGQEKIVEFVVTRARKAFAIAIYARLDVNRVMRWFKRNNIDDKDLPIKTQTDEWKSQWRREFYDAQWTFFATVFSTSRHSHDLHEFEILPFVSKQVDVGRGSFGVVSQYVLHRKHLDSALPDDKTLAVKEIQATEDAQEVAEHWEKEVKALRKMNGLNQEHIVHFVTAFRRHKEKGSEEHYLMFEWADGGNLRSLWKSKPSPILTALRVKDVIKQILGLAKALEAAHNLNRTGASYRHGDLKPENILVFGGGGWIGTLKIGDWGEASENEQVTEMRPSKTAAKYGTRRYEPPEVVTGVRAKWLGQPTRRRSRLYDIWAMGCIVLELLVWLMYGVDELNRFNQDLGNESFYQTDVVNGREVARVHSAAVRWMEKMALDPRCKVGTTALGDLLELVRTGLLVVKLPRRLGTNLSLISEKPRADSFVDGLSTGFTGMMAGISSHDEPTFSEPHTANIPSISFTAADPEPIRIPLQPEPEPEGPARFLATGFLNGVEAIDVEDEEEIYWDIQQHQQPAPENTFSIYHAPSPAPIGNYAEEDSDLSAAEMYQPASQGFLTPKEKSVNYAPPELDGSDWKFQPDNEYTAGLFASLRTKELLVTSGNNMAVRLCTRCTEFRDQVCTAVFSMSYEADTLQASAKAKECGLCILLWNTVSRNGDAKTASIKFDRTGPSLKTRKHGSPVLAIIRGPEQEVISASDVQIGFITLPEAGNATHFGVLQHWLNDCDNHHTCRPLEYAPGFALGSKTRLPTRLIDVSFEACDDSKVRLWETLPEDDGEWVALSHRWGDHHFSTTPENLQEHLNGIKLSTLPATFRDAVAVTRALGRRYLWIDSLCVIQGPNGDFRSEVKRMEEVYSGAYCVVAASCAADHYSGFLKARKPRDYVGMCREGKDQTPFYVCQTIDDFKGHVVDGELHRRGWVLQEHALARRTLFFTEHQTYFECKNGVRCETSTKMYNKLAAFLGDSDFPHILSSTTKGGKIRLFQELYQGYSRLSLSKPYDRPTAIDGLQQRLLRTMKVNGGFGVFDEGVTRGLLRRSLLWCRGADTPSLSRIHFPPDSIVSHVPSWSWMAYTGGIDYLQPGFGHFEWEDLKSPWSPEAPDNASSTNAHAVKVTLGAKAREYDLGAAVQGEGELIFDTPAGSSQPITLCVVLGKAKGCPSPEMQKHYLLIVTSTANRDRNGEKLYKRVGVGWLPGKCLSPNEGRDVKII